MRFITIAIALSCLLFVDAKPADVSATTSITASSISGSSLISASTTKISVKVPSDKDEEDDEENSPALTEEKDDDDSEEEAEETEEGLSSVDGTLDENMFASAGIVYNKDKGMSLTSKQFLHIFID